MLRHQHQQLDFVCLQANCIDSTAEAEAVFAGEVNKLKAEKIKPLEQLTLEPYERDHAVVVGIYRWVSCCWLGVFFRGGGIKSFFLHF